MPTPGHVLATFRGTLGPAGLPKETWSFGLRFGDDVTGPSATIPAFTQATAEAMHTSAVTLITSAQTKFSRDVEFTHVRLYPIGIDGHALAPPLISTGAVARGATTTNLWPWQCSIVATLKADGLGRGRFGRIYLPPMGQALDVDGGLPSGAVLPIRQATSSFLAEVANAAGFATTTHLVVIGTTGAAGTIRRVMNLRMGRVVDTQRRRRRSLDELYISALISE